MIVGYHTCVSTAHARARAYMNATRTRIFCFTCRLGPSGSQRFLWFIFKAIFVKPSSPFSGFEYEASCSHLPVTRHVQRAKRISGQGLLRLPADLYFHMVQDTTAWREGFSDPDHRFLHGVAERISPAIVSASVSKRPNSRSSTISLTRV